MSLARQFVLTYMHFTVFDTDGITPLTGQAGLITGTFLARNGAAAPEAVGITEIGATGHYFASFTPLLKATYDLEVTCTDDRVVGENFEVYATDLDYLDASVTGVYQAIDALNDISIADVQLALTNQGYTVTRATYLDRLDASVSGIYLAIDALNDISIADVQTAMTNQGYTAGRAVLLDYLDASVSGVYVLIDALNDLSIADVQTAMTNQGYTTARAVLLDYLDASVSGIYVLIDALNDISIADVQTALTNQGYTAARAVLLDILTYVLEIGGENTVWTSLTHTIINSTPLLTGARITAYTDPTLTVVLRKWDLTATYNPGTGALTAYQMVEVP